MLELFKPEGAAFNRTSFATLTELPAWALGTCAVLCLVVLWLCWRNLVGVSTRARLGLFSCRFFALVILCAMLFEVNVRLEKVQRSPSKIAVLIDMSSSMNLPASATGTTSRMDKLRTYLKGQSGALKKLAQNHQIEFVGFGQNSRRLNDIDGLEASDAKTDLVRAFEHLNALKSHRKLVGIILLSDGADTETVETESAMSNRLKERLAKLDVPVYCIDLASRHDGVDLSVAHVAHDDFAFVRNAVSFEVTITASGQNSQSVPIILEENGVEVSRKQVSLKPEQNEYRVTFGVVPDTRGTSIFKVSLGALPGELVTQNNHRAFSVQVIRDKIRVLQVVGRPSWDVRALRRMLKQNPNIDLISFFILRTNESVDAASTNELSLIPFPTDELFYQELGSFDLVIFQNFTHRGFRMAQYMPRIRDFIHNGGGFVMVGGDQSFARGGYLGTPFEEFLPVKMSLSDAISSETFKPELTEVGHVHPVTRLIQSKDENIEAWAALREMKGWNEVAGVPDDAQVLLQTPAATGNRPFVTVKDFGRGRVLAVLGDDTWRWSFGASGSGVNPHFYYRFWGNAIRWLIRDPALNRLRISTPSETLMVGEPVELEAHLLSPSFQPEANVALVARVEPLGRGLNQKEMPEQRLETDDQGVARFRFEFPKSGEYVVQISSERDEELRANLPLLVTTDVAELRTIQPNQDLLKSIATLSGGRYVSTGDELDELSFPQTAKLRIDARKDIPIWASWWSLSLLMLFLGLEWFFRRRLGMV